jgi:hypothetical protein
VIRPCGNYHSDTKLANVLICVVQTDRGQETLSLREFSDKHGWQNDPKGISPL